MYQLLLDNDIVGQIEAIFELKNYREQLVYDTLQSVAKSDHYFFKVRKHALRAL